MRMSESKRIKYTFPIKVFFCFNMATLFLFVFGAWNYNVTNYGSVILVVVSCNIALYLGGMYAAGRHNRVKPDEMYVKYLQKKDEKVIRLLWKWTLISAIVALPDMLYYSRMWNMTFSEIWQRLVIAFTQSNLNYSYSLNYVDSGTLVERIVVLASVLLYFFKFAVLPLTIFYWKKVDKKQKILCIYVTIVEIIKWLLKGMNKGIFDIVIVFIATSFMIIMSNANLEKTFSERIRKKMRKNKKKIISIAVLLGCAAVVVFILNTQARSGNSTEPSYYSQSMKITADSDNFLLKLIPKSLHSAVLGLDMYLTNGYQGLSYALQIPFKWCYGIGNNQFLISNFRDVLGIDVSELSYLYRVEEGFPWEEAHNWHTLYTWLANDVSFYLLPIVFFIYGLLFVYAIIDTIEQHNQYAFMVVCLFFIRFFYTSANNQVTSSSFSFIAWYVGLVMWYLSKHNIHAHLMKKILVE